MPLPSNTDLATLNIAYLGAPFVQVEAKSLDTETLDIAYLGTPFVAVGPAAVAPGNLNVYVRVAGTWRQATAVWIREGGTWKQASSVSAKVAGAWKS